MSLIFNEGVWADTGLPVRNDELVDNDCGCSEPLIMPTLMPVCNVETLPEGEPLVPPVLNFSEPIPHSFDRSGISPIVRGGVPSADSQYGLSAPPRAPFNDGYEQRLEDGNRENKRRLGLLDPSEPLVQPSMMDAAIADSRQRSRK
jgi:hypothetical protein